ncbi:MAG: hypothetical protein IPO00_09575 [Betaproteobacteria bacterium]|nr:hypothetical protein [Betaproteobacteria bacterium]
MLANGGLRDSLTMPAKPLALGANFAGTHDVAGIGAYAHGLPGLPEKAPLIPAAVTKNLSDTAMAQH